MLWNINRFSISFITLQVLFFNQVMPFIQRWALVPHGTESIFVIHKKGLYLTSIGGDSSLFEMYYGPDSFGDIMGGCENLPALRETSSFTNNKFTSIERVVLCSHGNLQLIMSAYYGSPVSVRVDKCESTNNRTFDRCVSLLSKDKVFCVAESQIELLGEDTSNAVLAVSSGKVGLGQLFRYLGRLPTFRLLSAAKSEDGTITREYTLTVPELNCKFRETFSRGFLDESYLSD